MMEATLEEKFPTAVPFALVDVGNVSAIYID